MSKSIYVASSWRNPYQPEVVQQLLRAGYRAYDFREPYPGIRGFHWLEIDSNWKSWTPEQFRDALLTPLAKKGFNDDYSAMLEADAFVMVLPCGRSAHLELGWATGIGIDSAILAYELSEPELMYKLADKFCVSLQELMEWLATI